MAKKEADIVRKELPRREIVWVRQHALSGNQFLVTSAPERAIYNLYQVVENGFVFLGKDKSPKVLYEIIAQTDPTAVAKSDDEEEPKRIKRR